MTTLSVIIPAYNEEAGIGSVIERVRGSQGGLTQLGLALETLVVDDGSRDRTAQIVGRYPDVRLIRHSRNRGYGAAIKTGFRHATGIFLAFLDADGTYPPESLPELCRAALQHDADLVIGSRMGGMHSEMPLMRRVGNLSYSILLSLIGNTVVRDTTSGMRLLHKRALAQLYPLSDGLDFTPAMSTRAIHENLKIVEVPIPYAERIGHSKLNVVRDGFRFTNAIVWTALAYNPVRVLGFASLAALACAGAIGLYILLLRLSGVTTLNAWQVFALFAAVVLSVLGISLLSLGAMFNYLVALFHKRPVRQGLFGKPILRPAKYTGSGQVFEPPLVPRRTRIRGCGARSSPTRRRRARCACVGDLRVPHTGLDHHFGWMGIACALVGLVLGSAAFALSLSGWEMARLWFYLLVSALLIIIGVQLSISWIVMRVLEELAERESSVQRDLVEPEPAEVEICQTIPNLI